jgi:DNA-directed RNA polymerase subunit RPC12/RpoP
LKKRSEKELGIVAQCTRFACENCSNAVEAWDDGNPYYFDRRGKKKYAYHPDPKRERCVGNDSPRLCLECGAQTMVDSKAPVAHCATCSSDKIVDLFKLAGHQCPACKLGVFTRDPDFFCVS